MTEKRFIPFCCKKEYFVMLPPVFCRRIFCRQNREEVIIKMLKKVKKYIVKSNKA